MIGDSRTEILGKIRRGLASRHAGALEHPPFGPGSRSLFESDYQFTSSVEKFKDEMESVSGEVTLCSTGQEVAATVRKIIETSGFSRIAISSHEVCRLLKLREVLSEQLPTVEFVEERIDPEDRHQRQRLTQLLARVDLSITGAEFLLADTGSLVTLSGSSSSRQISLLPQAHLVIATADQVYPTLAALVDHLFQTHGPDLPWSAMTLITGPSRTADIEKVLIKGVHGPNRLLTVILNGALNAVPPLSSSTSQL
ncbi:MAG: lactate utilization protein [Acidobacteriota bacterium]